MTHATLKRRETAAKPKAAQPVAPRAKPARARIRAQTPTGLRRTMESSFGADFTSVGIHTDAASHRLNRQLVGKLITSYSGHFFDGLPGPAGKALALGEAEFKALGVESVARHIIDG